MGCVFFARRLQRSAAIGEGRRLAGAEDGRIFIDHGEGTLKNGSSGTAVFAEDDEFGLRKMAAKKMERSAGCATEAVDGLIGISDGEKIGVGAGEGGEDLDLGEVGVLN